MASTRVSPLRQLRGLPARATGLTLAGTLALALALGSTAAAKSTTVHCGNELPYMDITATGLTCAQAKSLVKSASLTVTYTCTFGNGNPRLVSCHHGSKKVSYKIKTGGGQGY